MASPPFWAENACFSILFIANKRLLALGVFLFQAKKAYNEIVEVKRSILIALVALCSQQGE